MRKYSSPISIRLSKRHADAVWKPLFSYASLISMQYTNNTGTCCAANSANNSVHWEMVSNATFRKMALAFPEATEQPHFEKTSFRVAKKIFATLDVTNKIACIKLSAVDQNVFAAFDKTIIYPVPNKWGQQGWTLINLQKIRKGMCADALQIAYTQVAPMRLRG